MHEFIFLGARQHRVLGTGTSLDTLDSYAITPRCRFDQKEQDSLATAFSLPLNQRGHLDFFEHLDLSSVCEDFLFVHAGVRPGISLDQQSEERPSWDPR